MFIQLHPEVHYPSFVTVGHNKQSLEPPGIEGFVSRIKVRNENQRERLYLTTAMGFLILVKAAKAHQPDFPSLDPEYLQDIKDRRPGRSLHAFRKQDNRRMLDNLLRCKGAVRLREIREVVLDETCVSCRKDGQHEADAQSTMQKASDTASKVAASIAGNLHNHEIVEIRLADDRKIRFEVSVCLRMTVRLKAGR